MNILITGGTGLIGSTLLDTLVERGHKIYLITRDKQNASRALGKLFYQLAQVATHLDDINFDTLDAVINLAGEPIVNKRWSKNQKQRLCESRWQLTSQLVDRIKQANTPPSVFISGSAIGLYGRQGAKLIDEDFTAYHSEFSHDLCLQWEQIALQAASSETRVCLLRTGIVLSKTGGALAKMLPSFRLGLGGPISSGEQGMSWIHIQDMIRGILFLLENSSLSGVFNFTAPKPVSNEDFSKGLAKQLHRPCLFRVPAGVLNLLLGEMSELLVYGQYVYPKRLIEAGFVFDYEQLAPALQEILSNKGNRQ